MFKQVRYGLVGLTLVSTIGLSMSFAQERRGNVDDCMAFTESLDEGGPDGASNYRRINSIYDYWYEKGEFEDEFETPITARIKLEPLRWYIYGGTQGGQEAFGNWVACNDLAMATEDWKQLDILFKELEAKVLEMEAAGDLEFTGVYADPAAKEGDEISLNGAGMVAYKIVSTGEWLEPNIVDGNVNYCDLVPCTR